MISPSQSYHLACGSPAVEGAADLPAGSVCAACGYPAQRGLLMRKWPGADSLILDKLRAPASPYACDGCVWSCTWAAPPGRSAKEGQGRGPSPPMYSHLVILDDAGRMVTYANASKGEKPVIRSWLTSHKPGPWWLVVADMGKKQLIPWAEWNLSVSTRGSSVLLDDEPVSVGDLGVVDAMAHVLTVGATKATVETGDYTPHEWARCADDLRAFEAAWGHLRGGAWFRLALWLAQRDEDAVAARLEEEKAARDAKKAAEKEARKTAKPKPTPKKKPTTTTPSTAQADSPHETQGRPGRKATHADRGVPAGPVPAGPPERLEPARPVGPDQQPDARLSADQRQPGRVDQHDAPQPQDQRAQQGQLALFD